MSFLKPCAKDTLHDAYLDFFSTLIDRKIEDFSKLADGTLIANYLRLDLGEKPYKTSTELHSFEPPENDPEQKEYCNWIYIGHYVTCCWARLNPRLSSPIDTMSILYSRFTDHDKDIYLAMVMLLMYLDVTRKGHWELYLQRKANRQHSNSSGCSMPKSEDVVETIIKEVLHYLMFSNNGYFMGIIDRLEGVNNTIANDLKNSQTQYKNLKSQVGRSQLMTYNLNRDIEVLNNSCKAKDDTIKELEKKMVLLKQENKMNVNGRLEFQEEAEELRTLLDERKKELVGLKEKFVESNTLYEKYKLDYERLIIDTEKHETYDIIMASLKKESAALKQSIAELEGINSSLSDQNMALSKKNLELELKIKDLESTKERLLRQADLFQKSNQTRTDIMNHPDFRKKERVEFYGQELISSMGNGSESNEGLGSINQCNKTYMYRLLCIELAKEIQFYFKELHDMVLYFEVLKDDSAEDLQEHGEEDGGNE